jgi:hypothetical protein
MTNEEIDKMPAGREMDALIGEAIGWKPEEKWWGYTTCPCFSEDDAAALQALDKALEKYLYCELCFDSIVWSCRLFANARDRGVIGQADLENPGRALAIGRAVLKGANAVP